MRWIVGLALCAIVSALSLPAAAEATFPGANGRIAYECWPEICVTNASGTFKKKLTSWKRRYSVAPSFSANGRRIVFARKMRHGRMDLYLMRSDGSGVRRLTHSARGTFNYGPEFTPDGRSVVFTGKGGIRILNLATGITTLVPGSNPAVSPDGTMIAFEQRRNTGFGYPRLWVMGIDGSSPTPVSSAQEDVSAQDPNWTPDGERIAYDHFELIAPGGGSEQGIFTIKPDGSELSRLTPESFRWATSPAISPNGQRLAFVVDDRCDSSDYCRNFLAVHDIGSDDYELVREVGPGMPVDWGPRS
jgi:Tol biopolymer transport system component